VAQRLPVGVADDEAGTIVLDLPWWREAAGRLDHWRALILINTV
jgi:hypothetical protein